MVERIQELVHEVAGNGMTKYASPDHVDDGDDEESNNVGAEGLSICQLRVRPNANAPQCPLLLANTAEDHDLNKRDDRIDHI